VLFRSRRGKSDAQQQLRCEANGSAGGTVIAKGGPPLFDGKPHRLVCKIARDPDALEAYVSTCNTNACTELPVLVARTVAPIGSIMSSNPLTVGRHPPPENAGFVKGWIDEILMKQANDQ
jgi:hypothetical protein